MTTQVAYSDQMSVTLADHMAGDDMVVRAAKVSTLGLSSLEANAGLPFINFLMKNRHGSPFEHAIFTFTVHAPIFVWREIMRHRMASYNGESGRYKQLDPLFYIPNEERNLVQEGKPGHYVYVPGTPEQQAKVAAVHRETAAMAYYGYEMLLEAGIAKEVARMSLPLNIYSSAFVTMNARGLMNFLSLRTKDEHSLFPSYPQREIEMVAEQMEEEFKRLMPLTYLAFHTNGRVAP